MNQKEIKLAENLRRYRNWIDVTQDEMAAKLEIHRATYQAYESRGVEPNADTLLKIARTIGVTVDDLCFGDVVQVLTDAQKGGQSHG